jgi:hypothetical protein
MPIKKVWLSYTGQTQGISKAILLKQRGKKVLEEKYPGQQ